jgi:tetratricopeptide (TPR) repeat protein
VELYRGEGRTAEAEKQPLVEMGMPTELASLDGTAAQYEKDGLYVEAEVTYRRAVAWLEAHQILSTGIGLGPDWRAERYNRIGGVLEKQGRNDQAEAVYKAAIELLETADPNEPENVANFDFRPLLGLYRTEGRVGDIGPIIKNALRIQETRLGERSPRVVQTLLTLADVYQEEAKNNDTKYAEAQPLYERALDIQQFAVGPEQPQLLLVLNPYCNLLRKMHQDAKAAEIQSRIDRINQARQKASN